MTEPRPFLATRAGLAFRWAVAWTLVAVVLGGAVAIMIFVGGRLGGGLAIVELVGGLYGLLYISKRSILRARRRASRADQQ